MQRFTTQIGHRSIELVLKDGVVSCRHIFLDGAIAAKSVIGMRLEQDGPLLPCHLCSACAAVAASPVDG